MTQNIQERPTEEVDGIPASMRNCRACVHVKVCELHRTLLRSMDAVDKEFGDMADISVIHNRDKSFIDMVAQSCMEFKSPSTDIIGGR